MDFDQHLLGSEDNVYLPGTASGVSEDAISVFSQKRGNTVQHLPHSMHHSAMSQDRGLPDSFDSSNP